MSISSHIIDSEGRPLSSITSDHRLGVAVATFPAKEYSHFDASFLSKLSGNEMAKNGLSSGGLSLNIWDGTGALDTGTLDWAVSGNPWTETLVAAQSGSNGFDTGVVNGGKTFLDNGTPLDITAFSSLQFWINPQFMGGGSDVRVRWEDSGFNNLGNRLSLSNYINWNIGAWTLVSIPISDFGITSPVQRIEFSFKNNTQQHYIDNISLVTAGGVSLGPQIYSVHPESEEEILVKRLRLTLVADQNGWSHNTFANLPSLLSGLILRVKSKESRMGDKSSFSVNLKDNMDLFGQFSSEDIITFSPTGRLITFFTDFHDPIRLRDGESIEFLVRDDLSSLTRLQARAFGGKRDYKLITNSKPYRGKNG